VKRKAARAPTAAATCAVTAVSGDGVVVFKLEACAGCLHVERSQLRTGAGRVTQSMRFEDDLSFIRWCDADRLRFTYPLLYANLKRSGCALFPAAP
jgi:hypothetical protein